jgi:chemotaxis response regulator CheB
MQAGLISSPEGTAMSLTRILVFGNGLLLDAGIVTLLSREPDLEIAYTESDDTVALLEQIETIRPNAVVLDELTYRADRTKLLTFFENCPEIRVVMASADSNLLWIYQGQQVAIRQATDFVNIVRGVQNPP